MTTAVTPNVFPHASLTPIIGEPTPSTLQTLGEELYANAQSHTNGGHPEYGLLFVVLSAAAYQALPGNPPIFIAPVHPGPHPGHAVGATSAPQITETNRAHLAAETRANAYNAGVAQLKTQLITAVDAIYFSDLVVAGEGLANITFTTMLTYLRTEYGTLTVDMLTDNTKLLHSEFAPGTDMKALWQRIKTCRDLVRDVDPITEATAIAAILNVLQNTGVFGTACARWRENHPTLPTQTLVLFKEHFNAANKERVRLLTTKDAGFHSANAAAGGTLVDGTAMWYCYTHGLSTDPAHTSLGCIHPCTDHKRDATALNMMGGCNLINKRLADNRGRPRPGRAPAGGSTTPPGRAPAGRGGAPRS